jgi:hypothetical protein
VKSHFLFLWVLVGGPLATSSAAGAEPTKQECAVTNVSAQDLCRAGKLGEARARFAVCTAVSWPWPIREDCAQRLDKATMPTVVPMAKNAAGHDLSAVRVTLDGQPLRDLLDGTAIAIDPSEHTFAFEADGRHKIEETAIVREGERGRRVGVVLASLDAPSDSARDPAQSSASSTWRSFGRRSAPPAVLESRWVPSSARWRREHLITRFRPNAAATRAAVRRKASRMGGRRRDDVTIAVTIAHGGGGFAVIWRW